MNKNCVLYLLILINISSIYPMNKSNIDSIALETIRNQKIQALETIELFAKNCKEFYQAKHDTPNAFIENRLSEMEMLIKQVKSLGQ